MALTPAQKKELGSEVAQMISETEEELIQLGEYTKPISPDSSIGRISRMDAINNKSVTEAALRQAEEKLRNLNRVLEMYGTDDFGKCIKCKTLIPLGRILFRPESLHCVNCAR